MRKVIVAALLCSLLLCSCTVIQNESASESSDNDVSEEYSPSTGKLENETIVSGLAQLEKVPALTLNGLEFKLDGSDSGLTLSSGAAASGGRLTMPGGSDIRYVPSEQVKAQRMTLAFTLAFPTLSDTPKTDSKFTNASDIFVMSLSDNSRWFNSLYDYAVRLRVVQNTDKTLSFYGYSESVDRAQLVRDSSGNTTFAAGTAFNIKLVFENGRITLNVNDASISYYCAYETITDFRMRVRKGTDAVLTDMSYSGGDSQEYKIPITLSQLIDTGCFKGYCSTFAASEGVYFNRLNLEQQVGSDVVTASSDSGVRLDFYTDSKNVEITYRVMDSIWATGWTGGFDVYLNGELSRTLNRLSAKGDLVRVRYSVPEGSEGCNRITVYFPPCLTLSVLNIRLNDGASFAPVKAEKSMLVIGDSITEGSGIELSSTLFSCMVARAYGLDYINQGVSGSTFSSFAIAGDYGDFQPDYILIAFGTNSYGDGSAKLSDIKLYIKTGLSAMVTAIKKRFPDAQVIGMLPIARTG
ncbi:MAG TPA: SGNH/GDSL hydrolase family protein, partial [Bacillota bacterium]|nr:SGNH/GDSL hydrolase family protein [Bacillota bacterium]